MKKNSTLLIASLCALLMASCDKKSTTTDPNTNNPGNNNPNNNPNPASPYYFKFTFDGTSYNLNADIPQYMPFYTDEVGGYQPADATLYPTVGLRLDWAKIDSVKESDLMSYKGKTIYFNDSLITPTIHFDKSFEDESWSSESTDDANYNVKITDITYLKKDTSGNALKIYVITGTCSAIMSNDDGTKTKVLSNGDFKFRVSRVDQ